MTSAAAVSIPAELYALLTADQAPSRESAWEIFLSRYSRLIRHTAARFGTSYDETMDRYAFVLEQLRQDDFRRLRKFQAAGTAQFTTWLVVVVRRLCLDHHRRVYGRSGSAQAASPDATETRRYRRRLADLATDSDELDGVADTGRMSITTEYRVKERGRILAGAVSHLETSDRLLIQLRFEEDLPAREIAARLGFDSLSQVYRRIEALLSTLRSTLRGAGIESAA